MRKRTSDSTDCLDLDEEDDGDEVGDVRDEVDEVHDDEEEDEEFNDDGIGDEEKYCCLSICFVITVGG